MAHTPGPWFVNTQGNVWHPPEHAGKTGVLVCRVIGDDDANARLIAAAPDLLAALKRCVVALSLGHSGATSEEATRYYEALEAARAAIARAEQG